MAVVIEIDNMPATDRLAVLRDEMLRSAIPLELRPYRDDRLSSRTSTATFGDVGLLTTLGSGATVVRTERLARDDTPPTLIVTVVEAGTSVVTQYGRSALLRAGDLAAYWSTAPFASTFEVGTLRHSFRVPCERLGLPERLVKAQLGRLLGPGDPLAVIVSGYLLRLAHSAPSLTVEQRLSIERPTVDLIRAILTASERRSPLGRDPLGASLAGRVVEYIDSHFHEHDLDAERVAAVHGISQRYLYLLLARRGEHFGDLVRSRRLAAAADALVSPSTAWMTVSAIAHDWGFADHSHFSREFRKAHGVTPSEWRALSAD